MDFSEIYRRYAPHVHRFSIYLSGNPARAEDLAAETFVHALCGRTSLRVDTVKAYLFGIARNLYRDLIERQRRLVPKSKFESTCRGQVKVFSFFSCHWPYVCHPDVPAALAKVRPLRRESATSGFHQAILEAKKTLVRKTLEQAGGNHTQAAKMLGLHPNNLHRLIRSLNLRPAFRKESEERRVSAS